MSRTEDVTLHGEDILYRTPLLTQWKWRVYYTKIHLSSPFGEGIIKDATITSKAFSCFLVLNCPEENVLRTFFDPSKS